MKKPSFTWYEKSFFLFGIMASTLFFVWAGILQGPRNHLAKPAEAFLDGFTLSNSGDIYILKEIGGGLGGIGTFGNTTITAKNNYLSSSPGVVFTLNKGLPAGVNWRIEPCTPNCTTRLVMWVAPTVAPGIYPITVTGNNGNSSATTTLNLLIDEMDVSCLPNPITIPAGERGSVNCSVVHALRKHAAPTVTVVAKKPENFSGWVKLQDDACDAPCGKNLDINVFDDAVPGRYEVTVTVSHGAYVGNLFIEANKFAETKFTIIVPEKLPPPTQQEFDAGGTGAVIQRIP